MLYDGVIALRWLVIQGESHFVSHQATILLAIYLNFHGLSMHSYESISV